MKVTYFKDTDTAVVELIDAPVEETRELNENVYLDLDARGPIWSAWRSSTHARRRTCRKCCSRRGSPRRNGSAAM